MPELTHLLLQMQSNLQAHIDRTRAEERQERQREHASVQAQLSALVEQQRIANGRTATNERTIKALSLRLRRIRRQGIALGTYTNKVKAAIAAAAAVVIAAIGEALHQALPKLFAFLTKAQP